MTTVYAQQEIAAIAINYKRVCWLFWPWLITLLIYWPVSIAVGLIQLFFLYKLIKALKLDRPWLYVVGALIPVVVIFIYIKVMKIAAEALRTDLFRGQS